MGWSNVSLSEADIVDPSAAVVVLKSAVAIPVILVEVRKVRARCGLSSLLIANRLTSGSSLYLG